MFKRGWGPINTNAQSKIIRIQYTHIENILVCKKGISHDTPNQKFCIVSNNFLFTIFVSFPI